MFEYKTEENVVVNVKFIDLLKAKEEVNRIRREVFGI